MKRSFLILFVVAVLSLFLSNSAMVGAQDNQPMSPDRPDLPDHYHAKITEAAIDLLPPKIADEVNAYRWPKGEKAGSPAVVAGAYQEDHDGVLPWWHHAWDPDTNKYWFPIKIKGVPAHEIPNLSAGTALDWSDFYFRKAIDLYNDDNKEKAYYYLGRAAHLLGDMSTPAHVHLDAHYGCPTLENGISICIGLYPDDIPDKDHYETFLDDTFCTETAEGKVSCKFCFTNDKGEKECTPLPSSPQDYRAMRNEIHSELTDTQLVAYNEFNDDDDDTREELWEQGPVVYTEGDPLLSDRRVNPDIFHIYYSMAELADDFGSNDYYGDKYDIGHRDQDEDFVTITKTLVPESISAIASLIQLFWDETHPLDKAVGDGLFFLRQQQYDNGSWYNNVGFTSLATVTFLNEGFDEKDKTVQKAIGFLVSNVKDDGSIYSDSSHRNYETSLALLALAGTGNKDYSDEITKARTWLLNSQWDEDSLWSPVTDTDWRWGGFGYGNNSRPDLSNTQFALLALHAAGVPDDDPVWMKALLFVKRCQNRQDSNDGFSPYDDGGFVYYPGGCLSPGCASYGSITGAGMWGLALAGQTPDDEEFAAAIDWVEDNYTWDYNPLTDGSWGDNSLFYYYMSMSKGLTMARKTKIGGFFGLGAHDWYRDMREKLIELQKDNGSWANSNSWLYENNPMLATSYALLALQTRRLPLQADIEMWIRIFSPADIHLYDAEGRHVGKDYESGGVDLDIPGSSYSDEDPQTIAINPPTAGNYNLQLVGTGNGPWKVEIVGYQDSIQVSKEVFEGQISVDEVLASDLNVGAFEGGLTIFSSEPEATAVLAVDPVSLTIVGLPGKNSTTTITAREIGEKVAVEDVTVFPTDFSDGQGNTIPAASILIDPTAFGIQEGGKRRVNVTIPVPETEEFARYRGSIIFESLNAGTRSTEITLVVNPGSITVVKETRGGDGTFTFTSGTLPQSDFNLTTSDGTSSKTFENLANGTYDVTESPIEGWALVSASCDDGSSPDAIEIDPNESVTCTFLNGKTGKIAIRKSAPEGTDTKFRFSGDLGTFGLRHKETRVFENLVAGDYMIAEEEQDGWRIESVECGDANISAVENGVGIELDEGEEVLCTFLNSPADLSSSIFMPMVSGN